MKNVQKRLEKEGYRFNFFQAIRLLESSYEDRPEIGHLGPFDQEVVKILPNEELSFSPADVSKIRISKTDDGKDKWTLFENFLGLYGPNSATPMYIAEIIAQCPREEDPLRDFLDIFNHRILSFYYRAWKKHNISASVSYKIDDAFSKILFSMIGWDNEVSCDDWRIEPRRLLRYSSYLCSKSRPACGLENIISDFFRIDYVDVIQFVSRRYIPPKSAISRLSNNNDGGRLGESFVLGDTITDVSGQFRVRLSSLSMNQFLSLQPGEPQYDELVFIINMYVRHQLGFSLELVLNPNQGGCVKISSFDPKGVLGRSAWLGYPSIKETSVIYEVGYDR